MKRPDPFAWLGGVALTSTIAIFVWMGVDIYRHGVVGLASEFFWSEPLQAGRAGGVGPILVSTLLILAVTLAAAVPLGLLTAIWLSETAGESVRRSLDVLAGVPSIVFGLFGNAFFCQFLGMGFSIAAGGLTLACMILPLLVRTIEEALTAVPVELRQGAAALGFSRTSTLWHLLLPAAAPAVAAGLILGIGRALAETAALIFTSGYVDRWPTSIGDSGRALSVHIFDLSMNVSGGDVNAYRSAFVLMLLLLVINGLASFLTRGLLGRRVVSK